MSNNSLVSSAKAAVLDISRSEPYLLGERKVAASTDLPDACNARLHVEPAAVAVRVQVHFRGDRRSRPDQRHFAPHDVPELGEFVDAGLANDSADPGDPRVMQES